MVGLMADEGEGGIDDGVALCLCGLGEYPQPELLMRQSCHCLIGPITIIMMWLYCWQESLEYKYGTKNPKVFHTNILYQYPR